MSSNCSDMTESLGPGPDDKVRIENSKEARDAYLQCQHCYKMKSDGVQLQKCASCKRARYCSKECQKANWSFHKNRCRQNVATDKYLAKLGPDHISISEELKAWTKYFRPTICGIIRHALDITHRGFKRNALVIRLSYDKSFKEAYQRFRIVACDIEPLSSLPASLSEARLEMDAQNAHLKIIGTGVAVMHCLGPIEAMNVFYQCLESDSAEEVIENDWKEVLMRTVKWEQDEGDRDLSHGSPAVWMYSDR